MSAPIVADWITAGGTAAIAVLGTFITLWQWTVAGFRPKPSARIEANRDAIELKIVNSGRAEGIVDRVVVVAPSDGRLIRVAANFDAFPDKEFRPLSLPGLASIKLIIEAPDEEHFPENVQLKVGLGRGKDRDVFPTIADVGLFGMKSVLPPGTAFRE